MKKPDLRPDFAPKNEHNPKNRQNPKNHQKSAPSQKSAPNQDAKSKYDDIINLPRPRLKHPRQPQKIRAAQFAPFAALTGFYDMTLKTEQKQLNQVENETIVEVDADSQDFTDEYDFTGDADFVDESTDFADETTDFTA